MSSPTQGKSKSKRRRKKKNNTNNNNNNNNNTNNERSKDVDVGTQSFDAIQSASGDKNVKSVGNNKKSGSKQFSALKRELTRQYGLHVADHFLESKCPDGGSASNAEIFKAAAQVCVCRIFFVIFVIITMK